MSSRALVVFVRHPRPGSVKTRLVPVLGEGTAAALYRAMAEAVLGETAPGAGEYERLVFFDPPEAAAEMRAWLPGLRLVPQSGSDLGARMSHALGHAFARGAGRAAIVGTDVPGMGRAIVSEALDALDEADLVIGPAEDGGYYLLALARPQPALFEGIAWSTSTVATETLRRAAALGLRVHRLPARRDVDTAFDLREEWPRVRPLLAANEDLRRRLEAALELAGD